MKNSSFIIILTLLLYSCSDKASTPLEQALMMAGENRQELEKVLNFYSRRTEDSLKYKAACFLIENMPYHFYYEGELLDQHLSYYRILQERQDLSPQFIIDSLSNQYGSFSLGKLSHKYDIQEIDSLYLCENIEHSFKVWTESAWGKNISFEDFCETILPYRLGNEKLTSWKKEFYEKYSPLIAEITHLPDNDDPLTAARLLTDSLRHLRTRFTMLTPPGLPDCGPFVCEYLSGTCHNVSQYTMYIARALGIPCSEDYIPLKGKENYGHSWTTYYDKNRTPYMQEFLGPLLNAREEALRATPKIKVYRHTFSINRYMQAQISSFSKKDVHPLFMFPKFQDVTIFYSDCYVEKIKIDPSFLYDDIQTSSGIAYLCMAKWLNWEPVAYTKFDKNNLCFEGIHKGTLVRLATYKKGKMVFLSPPFHISCPLGEMTLFDPSEETEEVHLFTKTYNSGDHILANRMIGGVFEGSNEPDFITKDTLYHIHEKPYRLYTNVKSLSDKPYQYVRYYGPPRGFCNVAEIAFYENTDENTPLSGKPIGTIGSYQNQTTNTYLKALDGNTETSFDYPEADGGWVGLDLGKPTTISYIVYTPRNHDNYIRPGDVYECFYLDKEWVSLGREIAIADSLVHTDIPANTLIYIRNHTRGVDERPFVYNKGKLEWW